MAQFQSWRERYGYVDYDEETEEVQPLNPETPEASDSWEITKGIKSGVDQLQGIGGGLVGVVGDVIGVDRLRDWGLESYRKNMEEAQLNQARVKSYDEIENVGDAVAYAMFGIGNALPMFAPTLVSGGVGAIAARKATQAAVTKLVEKKFAEGVATGLTERAALKLAANVGDKAAARGFTAGAVAGGSGLETGSIYGEVFDETGEHRPGVALSFGTVAGAIDAMPMGAIFKRMGIGKKAKDEIMGKIQDGMGTFIGKQFLKEASTEGVQTVIERAAIKWVDENKDIFTEEGWKEITNATILGGIAGGGIAAPTSLMNRQSKEEKAAIRANQRKASIESDTNKNLDDLMQEISDEVSVNAENNDLGKMKTLEDLEFESVGLDELKTETLNREPEIGFNYEASEVNPVDNLELEPLVSDAIPYVKPDSEIDTGVIDNEIARFEGENLDEQYTKDLADFDKELNKDEDIRSLIQYTVNNAKEIPSKDAVQYGEVTLEQAVRNNGGIATRDVEGYSGSEISDVNKEQPGNALFKENGQSTDEMRETLVGQGWPPEMVDPAALVSNITDERLNDAHLNPQEIDYLDISKRINTNSTRYEVKNTLDKYLAGEKLTANQQRILDEVYEIQKDVEKEIINSSPIIETSEEYDPQYQEQYESFYQQRDKQVYDKIRNILDDDTDIISDMELALDKAQQAGELTVDDVSNIIDKYLEVSDGNQATQEDTGKSEGRSQREPTQKQDEDQVKLTQATVNSGNVAKNLPDNPKIGDQDGQLQRNERNPEEVQAANRRRSDARENDPEAVQGAKSLKQEAKYEPESKRLSEQRLRPASDSNDTLLKDKSPSGDLLSKSKKLNPKLKPKNSISFNDKTFNRGDWVQAIKNDKDKTFFKAGKVDGISHKRNEVKINGVWHDIGSVESTEKPIATPAKKTALSKVIESNNKKTGADFNESDLVPVDSRLKPKDNTHTGKQIDELSKQTNTNPSDAQIEADNYKKAPVKVHGFNIKIENPKGSTRSGTDPNGKDWSVTMKHHYGDIKGFKGADGDDVDVFIGGNPKSDNVFIINQIEPKSLEFDELKVILGVENSLQAMKVFVDSFDGSGHSRVGSIYQMNADNFKRFLKDGKGNREIKRESGISRKIKTPTLQDLELYAKSNKQSKRSTLSQLRGKRDKSSSRTDDVLEVSGSGRGKTDSASSIRQDRQQRGLLPRESTLVNKETASAEYEKKSSNDRGKGDKELNQVGRSNEPSSVNDTLQTVKRNERGSGDNDTSKIQRKEKIETAFDPKNYIEDESDKGVNAGVYPLTYHSAIMRGINNGEIKINDFQLAYDRIDENKEEITKRLNTFKKAGLMRLYGTLRTDFKKPQLIEMNYKRLKSFYSLGKKPEHDLVIMGFRDSMLELEAKTKKMIKGFTQKDLDERAAVMKQKMDEVEVSKKAKAKALDNPETWDEFVTFLGSKPVTDLSPEKLALHDQLFSEEVKRRRTQSIARSSVVSAVVGDVEYETIDTQHTKKGHDLFVVKLAGERLPKERYYELRGKAKQLGGYYSSFSRDGAIPGFQFTTKENREKFINVLGGKDESSLKNVEDRYAHKKDKRVRKLLAMADKIEEQGSADLNQDRKTNTSKRAREAAGATEAATQRINFARTMRAIAQATEDGTVSILSNLGTQIQLSELKSMYNRLKYGLSNEDQQKYLDKDSMSNLTWKKGVTVDQRVQFASFQDPELYASTLRDLSGDMRGVKGFMQASKMIDTRIKGMGENETVNLTHPAWDKIVAKVKEFAKKDKYGASQRVKEKFLSKDRLEKMGITNTPMLREAMREMARVETYEKAAVDPLKMKELDLVGRKDLGIDFFPTPEGLANRVIEEADIEAGMKVLEPSAGKGDLADAAAAAGAEVDTVELSPTLREFLDAKDHNVIGNDFNDLEVSEKYDRIVMNPPFSNGLDADHVQLAYKHLKPGGRIVAITGRGIHQRGDKKATAFREWLGEVGATIEELPEGSFKSAFRQTGVATNLVIIDKSDPKYRVGQDYKPMPLRQSQKIAAEMSKEMPYAKFNMVNAQKDLPVNILMELNARDIDGVKGVIKGDSIYIVASNHNSVNDIRATILHEVVGHYGLKKLLGKKEHGNFMDKVWDSISPKEHLRIMKEHNFAKKGKALKKKYGESVSQKMTFRMVADEYVAEIAESGSNPTVLDRIVVFFKDALRKIFPDMAISDSDIKVALARTKRFLKEKGQTSLSEISLTRKVTDKNGNVVELEGSAESVKKVLYSKMNAAYKLMECIRG